MLLEVNVLHAEIDGKGILKGLNLEVSNGEVYAACSAFSPSSALRAATNQPFR